MEGIGSRPDLRQRNRRVGALLLVWIVALSLASLIVAWVR